MNTFDDVVKSRLQNPENRLVFRCLKSTSKIYVIKKFNRRKPEVDKVINCGLTNF